MRKLPETMKAVVLTGHGDLDQLAYHEDWPVPVPGDDDVLIKVHACGLNNTDVNTRTAWYSKSVSTATSDRTLESADSGDAAWGQNSLSFPRIQGADVAGTVFAVGDCVSRDLLDKRVMIDCWLRDWQDPLNLEKCRFFGSECDGGFAEYTVVNSKQVHIVECSLSNAELATFATSWVTAENMLERANVTELDTVLVTGASGGVGSALVQLANRRGAVTIAMATKDKHDQLEKLSPNAMIDRNSTDLKSAVGNAIGKHSVTVVADIVGGANWKNLIDLLAQGGRYTCAGAIAGPIVELDLRTLYLRDLTFTGCTVVAPDTFGKLVDYIERDEVSPILAATYPLAQLQEAQAQFIRKQHVGNFVVTMD